MRSIRRPQASAWEGIGHIRVETPNKATVPPEMPFSLRLMLDFGVVVSDRPTERLVSLIRWFHTS